MISPDKYDLIFWDFDGVIKESVSVKTDAYVKLFQPHGSEVCKQIKNHHLANGGMSRFDKIPLYLKWAGLEQNDAEVQNYCDKFSRIVKDKVIASAWVPGVQDFLQSNKEKYIFIMVSATPQDEIEEICNALNLDCVFLKIYGSPASKSESIKISMLHFGVDSSSCVMVGDAQADIDAAQDNNVDFIFRRHQENLRLNINTHIQTIENFNEL
jgi:phosphoglycolate phosphatase-like HAD superfamily hydrolase